MNILLVTGPDISLKEPYASGIEAFVVGLGDTLVTMGHTVNVVAAAADDNVQFKLVQLANIDTAQYQIIHYNLFIPELYHVAGQFVPPAVVTLHSPVDEPRSQLYRWFAQQTSVQFVAISQRMAQQWQPALQTTMPVIHNGIDLDKWPLQPRAEDGYVLWSGRLTTEKNVGAAIALAQYLRRPLKIAGRIVDEDYFRTQVEPQLNNTITYVGHTTQAELSQLAAGAAVFLATASWQEPFGFAALEMLASGLPVVGFASALPPDLRQSPVAVAASSNDWHDLLPLVEQATSTSPEQCRSFAAAFNLPNMTQAYAQLYQQIIV